MKKFFDFSYLYKNKYSSFIRIISIFLIFTIFSQSLLFAEPSIPHDTGMLGVELVSNPLVNLEIKRETSRYVDLLAGIIMAFSRNKNHIEVNSVLRSMYSSRETGTDIEFLSMERTDGNTLDFTFSIHGINGIFSGTYESQKSEGSVYLDALILESVYESGDRVLIRGSGEDKRIPGIFLSGVPVPREAFDALNDESADIRTRERRSGGGNTSLSHRKKERGRGILSFLIVISITAILVVTMFSKILLNLVDSRKELTDFQEKVLEVFYPDHWEKYIRYSKEQITVDDNPADTGIDPSLIRGKLYSLGLAGQPVERYLEDMVLAIKVAYDRTINNVVSPDRRDYHGWSMTRKVRSVKNMKSINDVFIETGARFKGLNDLVLAMERAGIPESRRGVIIMSALLLVRDENYDIVLYPSNKAISSFARVIEAFAAAEVDPWRIAIMSDYYLFRTAQRPDDEIDAVTASHVEAADMAREFMDNYSPEKTVPYRYVGYEDFKDSMEFLLSLKRKNPIIEYTDESYPYEGVDNIFKKGAVFLADHYDRGNRKELIRKMASSGNFYMIDCAYAVTVNYPWNVDRAFISGDPNESFNLKNFMDIYRRLNALPVTGEEVREAMLSITENVIEIKRSGRNLDRIRYFLRASGMLVRDWRIRVFTEPEYDGGAEVKRRVSPPRGDVSNILRFKEYGSESWFFIHMPRENTKVDITALSSGEQMKVLTAAISMAERRVMAISRVSVLSGTTDWLRAYLEEVAVFPPYILNMEKEEFLKVIRPSGTYHKPFRFPEYIWGVFKEELREIDSDIYTMVKENGLGWTDSRGIHFIDEIADSGEAAKIWEAAKNAVYKTTGNTVSVEDIRDTVYYHEDMHGIMSRNKRYVEDFRRYLENEVFHGSLSDKHPFILAFKRIYGTPGYRELDGEDVVDWYLEEMLVLSLQEKYLFDKESAVIERIGYAGTGEFTGILSGISKVEEEIVDAFGHRIKYNHNNEANLLTDAELPLNGIPLNMTVDLSLIPHGGEALTAEQAASELRENMKNIALLMAWYRFKGFDIRYEFFDREDNAFKDKAMEVLKKEIRGLLTVYDVDSEALMSSIDDLHQGDNVITVLLENKDSFERTYVPDRVYPVFLDPENEKPGTGIPNYKAAMAIGLSLAGLRITHDNMDSGEYLQSIRKSYREIKDIYERSGINADNFTENLLDQMVTGDSGTRVYIAGEFALPPIVRINIEQLRRMHEKLQEVLQAA